MQLPLLFPRKSFLNLIGNSFGNTGTQGQKNYVRKGGEQKVPEFFEFRPKVLS